MNACNIERRLAVTDDLLDQLCLANPPFPLWENELHLRFLPFFSKNAGFLSRSMNAILPSRHRSLRPFYFLDHQWALSGACNHE